MATRPATGSLKMPVTTVRPFQTTALGSPTLTDSTCSVDDGCMLLLLLIPSFRFTSYSRFASTLGGEVYAKIQRPTSQRVVFNNIHIYIILDIYKNHTIEKCTCQYPVSVV